MLTRVLRTAASTLRHTFYVDEDATAAGTVAVVITDANGATVTSGDATQAGTEYTFVLPAQAALANLTVSWAGSLGTEIDQVEIVGGFFFGIPAARGSDPDLADTAKFPYARLLAARVETEQECEYICDRAFVPRYGRATLNGSGTDQLVLGTHDIRAIRAIRVAPRFGQPFVPLTAPELAEVSVTVDSVLERHGVDWTEGRDNVIVEYEWGLDSPPEDLRRASLRRLRSLAPMRSRLPDRATSYTANDGTSYQLDLPGAFETGMPDVDAAYARYSMRSTGNGTAGSGRQVPASRLLNYDPQRTSLFHGGVR